MRGAVLILIGVVALLLIGCGVALTFMHDIADVADGGEYGTYNKVADKVDQKVDQVTSSDSSSGSSDSGSNIVSEAIEYNGQNDGGEYREVTYEDGGFRQYDKETGELIGSSYDEDQEQLGVVDGNLE